MTEPENPFISTSQVEALIKQLEELRPDLVVVPRKIDADGHVSFEVIEPT